MGALPPSFFQTVLERSIQGGGDGYFFVQIGANDGVSNDPLHRFVRRHRPRGILVEPQHDVFRSLVDNYRGQEGLRFANLAIARQDGMMPIYRIVPDFYETFRSLYRSSANPSGVSSLDRRHVEDFLLNNARSFFSDRSVGDYVRADEIETCTFRTFIDRYGIDRIDLLQVDTEGFDFEVVRMLFDSTVLRPRVLNFEHKNLSWEDRESCEMLLLERGYSLFHHRGNTCAFRSLALTPPTPAVPATPG